MRHGKSLIICLGAMIVLAAVSSSAIAQVPQTPTVLFNFDGSAHGANPYGDLTLSGSTMYGLTYGGGSNNQGTIFSVSTSGGTPKVMYSFDGTHGAYPYGDVTQSGTTLYGMTEYGGSGYTTGTTGSGTIFKISTISGTPTILFTFDGAHGAIPQGSLTLSGSTLYGMTSKGGANGYGTIFSIPTIGGTPTVLFSFDGTNHGKTPYGSLILSGSTLYGMTYQGGTYNFGTIFSFSTSGGTPNVLFSFYGPHGVFPWGSLTLSGSTLYGMTNIGGSGNGTVFSLATSGGTQTVLCSFTGTGGTCPGSNPYGSLMLCGSNLYGMTYQGGINNYSRGTIFSISTNGGTPTTLFNFDYTNGELPYGSLTLSGSTLYGMTRYGGTGNGTIFSIPIVYSMTVNQPTGGTVTMTPSQATYSPTNSVVTINAYPNPGYYFVSWSVTGGSVTNATSSTTSLTIASNCTLSANFALPDYTLTVVSANGTVTLTPNQATYHYGDTVGLAAAANSGLNFSTWTVTDSNGNDLTASCLDNPISPTANLIMPAANVTLTAAYASGYTGWEQSPGGTVSLSDNGPYTNGEVITATASAQPGCIFVGWNVSGASILSDPTALTTNLTVNGNFVLTAVFTYTQSYDQYGNPYTSPLALTTLFAFDGANGATPWGSLTLSGSTLYGMTAFGGANNEGTIFSVPTSGGTPTILFSFDGTHGSYPQGSLTLRGSTLYGLTQAGGTNNYGTIFSLPTSGGVPTVLFSFDGTHGREYGQYNTGISNNSLIINGSTLYGMSRDGGNSYLYSSYGDGTIFSLPTSGGTPKVLFNFDGTHGAVPVGDLTLSADGATLYGMALKGGASGFGTIFSLPVSGGTPTVLFSFDGPHGEFPTASLILCGSTLYGMTKNGGDSYNDGFGGNGAIFSIPTSGGTPTILYSFDGHHGQFPFGSLTLNGSTLYGMTNHGGKNWCGNIFSIPISGGTPRNMFSFDGYRGTGPDGSLTLSGSTLYGMTSGGGNGYTGANGSGFGTIFSFPILPGVLSMTASIWPNTPNWVYQNTPVTTMDRNVIAISISMDMDSWINDSYTVTVTQSGPGLVTPTQTWSPGTLVTPAGTATWAFPYWQLWSTYYYTHPFCYLVGGRVQCGGVVSSAANMVVTGSCTVHFVVTGNIGGTASADVVVYVRPLGNINNSGAVDGNNLAILNNSLNGFDTPPQTDDDCDLTGDGEVTTADRVLLNMIINGLALP